MLTRPLAIALVLAFGMQAAGAADDAGLEFFEKQVRPLLAARCYECHSAKSVKLQGGLRLDSLAAALKGGDTGPAVGRRTGHYITQPPHESHAHARRSGACRGRRSGR